MTPPTTLFAVTGPTTSQTRLRNSAKAIIIHDNRILLTENADKQGSFFLLPGGGQTPGETLTDTLRRECLEEIGVPVTVGPLLYIREYISRNHEFANEDQDVHQIEFMFSCAIQPGHTPSMGEAKDVWQTGISWVPLGELLQTRLYPKVLCGILTSPDSPDPFPVYLGDIN